MGSKTNALLCAVASGMVATTAHATLIAYDGFENGAVGGDLSGQAGGTGFGGPWAPGGFNASLSDNYNIAAGSLSFGPLLTSGNRVSSAPVNAIAGLFRPLTTPLGVNGTTRYLSFLVRPEGTINNGAFNGFFGVTLEQSGEPELYAGKPGSGALAQYVLEDRGGSGQVPAGALAVNQTALLVLKAQFGAAGDTFTLYLNPAPGAAEPTVGTIKSGSDIGSVLGLTIYSSGAFSLDELRVGETFADVTPVVPEPGAAAILAVGAVGALARRRRRN